VAESELHRAMKETVRRRLSEEGFVTMEEPLFPPSRRISWSNYRPDLLGFRRRGGREEIALVECETRPNMKRFRSKNYSSVWFQPSVLSEGGVKKILAVPRGALGAVDRQIMREWEVWVIGPGVIDETVTATI
jgi:hypothetical protein